jgi:hypothetical protein
VTLRCDGKRGWIEEEAVRTTKETAVEMGTGEEERRDEGRRGGEGRGLWTRR